MVQEDPRFALDYERVMEALPNGYSVHYSITDRTMWVWETGDTSVAMAVYCSKSRKYHFIMQDNGLDYETEVSSMSKSEWRKKRHQIPQMIVDMIRKYDLSLAA